jgi:hypothetical protein
VLPEPHPDVSGPRENLASAPCGGCEKTGGFRVLISLSGTLCWSMELSGLSDFNVPLEVGRPRNRGGTFVLSDPPLDDCGFSEGTISFTRSGCETDGFPSEFRSPSEVICWAEGISSDFASSVVEAVEFVGVACGTFGTWYVNSEFDGSITRGSFIDCRPAGAFKRC